MIDTSLDQTRASRSELLGRTSELANEFLNGVGDRPVARTVDFDKLLAEMGVNGLPLDGNEPKQIVEHLASLADCTVVATAGPRYFGFVVGGSLPVAVAADWLTAAWDQNAAFYAHSPLAAAAEQIAGNWLLELFGLSKDASVGFVTGGTMANFTTARSVWRASNDRHHQRRIARINFCVTPNAGLGKRSSCQSSDRRSGTHEIGSTSIDSRRHSNSCSGLHAGRKRQHWLFRSNSRDRSLHSRAPELASCRRCIRPLGGGVSFPSILGKGY